MGSKKCRVFLRNSQSGASLYLLWVQLNNQDFYWGSPTPSPDVPATIVGPGPATIAIPDDFDRLPTATSKTSFHASGVTHVTSDGRGAQAVSDRFVGAVTSFRQPTMFAAMYTAVPGSKEPYRGSLIRRGGQAIVIEVTDEGWSNRWYVDFLLSPAGTFDGVPGVGLWDVVPPLAVTHTLDLDLNLILAVRVAPIGGELNDWHPDKHLLIAVTPTHLTEADPEAAVRRTW